MRELQRACACGLLLLACSAQPPATTRPGEPEQASAGSAGAPPGPAGPGLSRTGAAGQPAASMAPEPAAPDAGSAPAPSEPRARVPLVDHTAWERLAPELDPFTDRPPSVTCTDEATAFELLAAEAAYGVDTGLCNYVTVRQRAREHVAIGERIIVRLWHFELSAPEPADAHAVVALDGEPLLDERIPIPSHGGLIQREIVARRAFAKDAPVLFHLHNHGDNSWALIEVSAGP